MYTYAHENRSYIRKGRLLTDHTYIRMFACLPLSCGMFRSAATNRSYRRKDITSHGRMIAHASRGRVVRSDQRQQTDHTYVRIVYKHVIPT